MNSHNYIKAVLIILLIGGFVSSCKKSSEEAAKTQASETPSISQSSPQTESGFAPAPGGYVRIGSLESQLPEGWASVTPQSSMRRAEFQLQAAPGDTEPGEVTAFYFGSDAGGIEANINRWYGQFTQPDGKQTEEVAQREEFEANDMRVVMVEFTGTMKASRMPGAPPKGEMANWMNLSAIVSTPEGPWFFKGTGPVATMTAHRDKMRSFITAMKWAVES